MKTTIDVGIACSGARDAAFKNRCQSANVDEMYDFSGSWLLSDSVDVNKSSGVGMSRKHRMINSEHAKCQKYMIRCGTDSARNSFISASANGPRYSLRVVRNL